MLRLWIAVLAEGDLYKNAKTGNFRSSVSFCSTVLLVLEFVKHGKAYIYKFAYKRFIQGFPNDKQVMK